MVQIIKNSCRNSILTESIFVSMSSIRIYQSISLTPDSKILKLTQNTDVLIQFNCFNYISKPIHIFFSINSELNALSLLLKNATVYHNLIIFEKNLICLMPRIFKIYDNFAVRISIAPAIRRLIL